MRGFLIIVKIFNYSLVFDRRPLILGLLVTGAGFALALALSVLERKDLALKVGLISALLGSYVYAFNVLRIITLRAFRILKYYAVNPARAEASLYHTVLFMNHYPELWVVVAGAAASAYLMLFRGRSEGTEAPLWLQEMAGELASKMGVRAPRVLLLDSELPVLRTNGDPGRPEVQVSVGALELFDREELMAALAHELGHIKHGDRDVLLIAVGAVLGSALSAFSIFTGIMVRRDQEYLADDEAVKAVGARPLIKALYKVALVRAPVRGLGFAGGLLHPSPYRRASRVYQLYVVGRVERARDEPLLRAREAAEVEALLFLRAARA